MNGLHHRTRRRVYTIPIIRGRIRPGEVARIALPIGQPNGQEDYEPCDAVADGRDKIGVFDPSTGNWYLDLNGDTNFGYGEGPFKFGQSGDAPIVVCGR